MFRLRHNHGIVMIAKQHLLPAGVMASFAAMILALPIIHRFRLQSWVVCPFHALTGFPCPTCGYTRTVYLAFHGRLAEALRFQPFVMIIVLLSGIAACLAANSLRRNRALVLPKTLVAGLWLTLGVSWAWNLFHRL